VIVQYFMYFIVWCGHKGVCCHRAYCKQAKCCRCEVVCCVVIYVSDVYLLSIPEIFIPAAYGMKNGRQKPTPENGVDLWRQFLGCVPWASGFLDSCSILSVSDCCYCRLSHRI